MKVTRTIKSNNLNQGKYKQLVEQANRLGKIRSIVWNYYGSIKGVSPTSDRTINLIDKAKVIAVEELTVPITGSKFGKTITRKLSAWIKGVIAKALDSISCRRGSSVILINSAYTSQVDSRYGILLGKRNSDSFYCFDGVVLPADENAARNVLARLYDLEIDRWTPFQLVKSILLERTERHRLGLLNPDSSCNS